MVTTVAGTDRKLQATAGNCTQVEMPFLAEVRPLHRLWPGLERAIAGMVFTADRAGEVQADMNTLREYSKMQKQAPGCKTPAGCSENGCLGWCDEYKTEGPKP